MDIAMLLLMSYLIGSIPTALIVSHSIAGVDIREIGDGNMGARNVTRTLGWKAGITVATIDFLKGGMAVLLADIFGQSIILQLLCGSLAVIGHDFPIWARFHGGQGMATILGMLFFLIPQYTIWGLLIFLLVYIATRYFDLSAAFGLGLLAFLVWYYNEQNALLFFVILLFISIPLKKLLDLPRRKRIRQFEYKKEGIDPFETIIQEDQNSGAFMNNYSG